MSFIYFDHILQAEAIPITQLITHYGSPCYIYSKSRLYEQWCAFKSFIQNGHQICYAVKANSNLAILALLAHWGAGFDIVSGGEFDRVLRAGGHAENTVFSGVGKTCEEIKSALFAHIGCFNVESSGELFRIEALAKNIGAVAPIALRVNPNIDPKTHPYITTGLNDTKFGLNEKDALTLYRYAAQSNHLTIRGISCHLGSQITTIDPFLQALEHLLKLTEALKKEHILLKTINLGGGLGVTYQTENVPSVQEYSQKILALLKKRNSTLTLILEPGRALIAQAGILVTKVEYLKSNHRKHFAIVDAGMNDLIRPALYQAEHAILPIVQRSLPRKKKYDIVGPICESSDFFGKNRELVLRAGDYLAIMDSGAYGFSMSSNYNSRPRAAELMVDTDRVFLIRSRETLAQLLANETIPPIS
ncbi:diaminopimelate decarboxylase [Rickettsiella grylli]|uniref:Diaminopimelate decarboxylase n=1 Tax=Rickettsiella grylli TaxID=59196 RepID=A8PN39_9COXI|nr:diaminopimelate decarboxylase [Rickettsiella grylli]EDP46943.1 diaminopimelate decarboxylase [Rickettsiella grylli]